MSALITGMENESAYAETAPVIWANGVVRAAAASGKIANGSVLEVPPHVTPAPGVHPAGAGVITLTWAVPTLATYASGIVALTPVGSTYIVVGAVVVPPLSVHWTAEHGTNPLPITVRKNAPVEGCVVPTAALFGMSEEIVGDGSELATAIVKVEGLEFVVELETVTPTGPGRAVSVAEIMAVSCVGLTNVVGRGNPFQFTTSPSTKFVPFTVKVMPVALQDGVVFEEVVEAESDVMIGRTIENVIPLEVPPPGGGVNTVTWAVPTAAISATAIVARSCVALL